jgi:hypothetical protein
LRRFALTVAAALLALPAAAFVPTPERLSDAAGRANYEAGRVGALRIEVALYTERPGEGDGEPIATGELLSDPSTAMARLDLLGLNGVHERHLLRGGREVAWREGEVLEQPRALLPPLGLLQMRYGRSLRGALRAMGVSLERADLGRSDGHDCFVIGGYDRMGFGRWPSLWLDVYSFEIVRVDRADGARFRFGPLRPFGEHALPGWVALEEPGKGTLYLQVRVPPS